jgi:hypothetical protein
MGHDLKQFKSLEVSLDFFIYICLYIFFSFVLIAVTQHRVSTTYIAMRQTGRHVNN